MTTPADPLDALARAAGGDERAFGAVVSPYERALFRHCYRMLGSGPDAEEALQDTLVRAWRRLSTYDSSGALGGWLYRIATNVCLDVLRSRKARVDPISLGPPLAPGAFPGAPDTELSWVEPVGTGSLWPTDDPVDAVMSQESISLAFVAALQRLAPRQRACLLLHDVLGFSQAEVAEALEISPSGVNSLLFRAREAARPRDERPLLEAHDPQVQELLDRYVAAWRVADIDGFIALVADDIRLSMPPMREWYEGRDAVVGFVEMAIFAAVRPYGIVLVAGRCNGQPAFATYMPAADGGLEAGGLQVLEVAEVDGRPMVTDIVSFRDGDLAVRCGFPAHLTL